jgi:hypothetical protein
MDHVFGRLRAELGMPVLATGLGVAVLVGEWFTRSAPLRTESPHRGLCHVGASPVDSDDQAALAKQYCGTPHRVVGHSEVAG